MSGATIGIEAVRFSYGAQAFVFDAAIGAGEIVAVMGPSGSGKSTLLNLVAGFEMPDTGRLTIDGEDVTGLAPDRRAVTMVFQENNLFGHLDIAANVGLGRSPSLRLTMEDRDRVAEALARTGLAGKADRLPAALSGGERQRAALARALVRDRPVLLLDEPFASLGPALRADMLDLVAELHGERGMTVLMVSHHPGDARRLGRRILFVDEGRIAADGPAGDLLGDNAPAIVADYLGSDPGQRGR
ncbi:MAG: thiamine ABC transporter ATP-binding protein [Rhizobiaceae bacterium]